MDKRGLVFHNIGKTSGGFGEVSIPRNERMGRFARSFFSAVSAHNFFSIRGQRWEVRKAHIACVSSRIAIRMRLA